MNDLYMLSKYLSRLAAILRANFNSN